MWVEWRAESRAGVPRDPFSVSASHPLSPNSSVCSSGVGPARPRPSGHITEPEALPGLTSCTLHTGASSVLASAWSVGWGTSECEGLQARDNVAKCPELSGPSGMAGLSKLGSVLWPV